MYDNWINELTESYLKTRLGINENDESQKEPDYHPGVHAAADYIHSVLDKHHKGHPKSKTLSTIHSNLGSQTPSASNIADAAKDAIHNHYGIEGHSYDVNDDVAGDFSERDDWEELTDNAVDRLQDKLHGHLESLGH